MALNHAIMTALLEDHMSGYELTKAFDTSLGFFWKASHQQIYKALRELETAGYLCGERVAQAGKPDKVVYQLTRAGRRALEDWVLGESQLREARDDLFVKLYNLSDANAAHLREEMHNRSRQAQARLALYRKIRERRFAQPDNLSQRQRGIYCALLAGIRHCESTIDWVAECDNLLNDTAHAN